MVDSYDEIPYESTPFRETHPDHLATLARLHGIQAADPGTCRVLELGCASGGNLVPMAWYLPGSRFLGVELSETQAQAGAALINGLGLENIRIRRADILDFDAGAEEFDYIIAHGLYSWVPQAAREKILAICQTRLSANGIAYISYNTLPGWRMRGMLRDMLLYHSRDASSPGERLGAARELLGFMGSALEGNEALSAQYLRAEMQRIAGHPASYLYHEYLEQFNGPLLFSDFVREAARHGLDYVCETDLQSMFPATIGGAAEPLLEGISDPLERWQYMDFLVNRNFRQSLLCRADCRPLRVPDLSQFERYAFFADLKPPKKLDLRRLKAQAFSLPDGNRHPVVHPLTRAALARLTGVYPDAVAFDTLATMAGNQVRENGGGALADQVDHLGSELFSLYACGVVGARLAAEALSRAPGERPRATALALAQVRAGSGQVATCRHASLRLDAFAKRLIACLDGSLDRKRLVEKMVQDAGTPASGEATMMSPGALERKVQGLLNLLVRQGLLES